MDRVLIDKAKCIKCGKCVNECPGDVLSLNGILEITQPELCIACGHCAAICPEEAIKSSEFDSQKYFRVQEIPNDLLPERLLFHKKRSIRCMRDGALNMETIKELVNYAEKAPSSHNLRHRKYLVLTGFDEIRGVRKQIVSTYRNLLLVLNPLILGLISIVDKKASDEMRDLSRSFRNLIAEDRKGNDKVFRNAKCIICIAAPTGSTQSRDDCIAAQHYMMLFGKTLGIDSFIVGYAQHAHRAIEKAIRFEKGYSVFSVSAFGFAKTDYHKEVVYPEPQIIWK